jgi:protoheme IX farnesyltransferase
MSARDVPVSAPAASRIVDFVTLTKPRLNAMAVFAVAVGWWAEIGFRGSLVEFAAAMLGAGGIAFGSSALNQVIERDRDALMQRTMDRPIPAGRVSVADGLAFGLALSLIGLVVLAVWSTPLAAGLGALTLFSYVCVYTPLKTRTSLNTLVGTVPGALPPLIGAAAATGTLSPKAWFLFALITAWQLPHFFSIAWLYRDDYARAGYRMLPAVTGNSGATARQIVVQALLTTVVSVAAVLMGLAGRGYFVVALLAGLLFVATGVVFLIHRTDRNARLVLRASLVHLPLVLGAFALLGSG